MEFIILIYSAPEYEKGGNDMDFMESIIIGLFCMLVVFAVLACLYVLIRLFSFGIRKIEVIGRKTE